EACRQFGAVHHCTFRNLEFEVPGLDVRLLQDVPNLIYEVRLRDLLAGKIHAHEQLAIAGRLASPLAQLLAGLLQNPQTDWDDYPGVFGQRNEVGWTDEPPLGMFPANQRLKTRQLAVIQ